MRGRADSFHACAGKKSQYFERFFISPGAVINTGQKMAVAIRHV
jgi:hypothetical protein